MAKEINPSEFDKRLNSLLKEFESLPKKDLIDNLSFYLTLVKGRAKTRKEEIERQADGMQFMSWPPHTAYVKMAEWADETMIAKACKWLENNLLEYWSQINANNVKDFIEKFKSAMEE